MDQREKCVEGIKESSWWMIISILYHDKNLLEWCGEGVEHLYSTWIKTGSDIDVFKEDISVLCWWLKTTTKKPPKTSVERLWLTTSSIWRDKVNDLQHRGCEPQKAALHHYLFYLSFLWLTFSSVSRCCHRKLAVFIVCWCTFSACNE